MHRLALLLAGLPPLALPCPAQDTPPNLILVFADDLGYGDLSSFGHPTIRTPHLDRLAHAGQKWTNFYVAASVCTPSRAGLLTGRLPVRSGMCSSRRRVLFPDSADGLPAWEITIARALKTRGYATGAIGKWHLGHLPAHLPTRHGFDSWFGIPYSNDMDKVGEGRHEELARREEFAAYDVPLMEGDRVVERPADQRTITHRYTERAVRFVDEHAQEPFFLYLAHNLPHIPLFRSAPFHGVSTRGLYGDVVEEIDDGIGRLVAALERHGIAERTLIVFTSDNGPWLPFGTHGGSAGLLRDGKGSTWEGGMRVPAIFSWPGRLAPGIVHELGATLDLFPTFLALAGVPLPADRRYDGGDLSPVLFGTGPGPRESVFYYHGAELFAVRRGRYKAHFRTKTSYVGQNEPLHHDPPLLYDLDEDPAERLDLAHDLPAVVDDLRAFARAHERSIVQVPNHLDAKL